MKLIFTMLLMITTYLCQSQNLITINVSDTDSRSDIQIINDTLNTILKTFHNDRLEDTAQVTAGNIQVTRVSTTRDTVPVHYNSGTNRASSKKYPIKSKKKKIVVRPRKKTRLYKKKSKYSKCYTF